MSIETTVKLRRKSDRPNPMAKMGCLLPGPQGCTHQRTLLHDIDHGGAGDIAATGPFLHGQDPSATPIRLFLRQTIRRRRAVAPCCISKPSLPTSPRTKSFSPPPACPRSAQASSRRITLRRQAFGVLSCSAVSLQASRRTKLIASITRTPCLQLLAKSSAVRPRRPEVPRQ